MSITQKLIEANKTVEEENLKVEPSEGSDNLDTVSTSSMLDDMKRDTDKDGVHNIEQEEAEEENEDEEIEEVETEHEQAEAEQPRNKYTYKKPFSHRIIDIVEDPNDARDPKEIARLCAIQAKLEMETYSLLGMVAGLAISGDWSNEAMEKYTLRQDSKDAFITPRTELLNIKYKKAPPDPKAAMYRALALSFVPLFINAGKDRKIRKEAEKQKEDNEAIQKQMQEMKQYMESMKQDLENEKLKNENLQDENNKIKNSNYQTIYTPIPPAPEVKKKVEENKINGRHPKNCNCAIHINGKLRPGIKARK